MKPTQEQILSALNKLVKENKTELKTEKIELGLVDDLEKGRKSIIDESDKIRKVFSDLNKIEDRAIKLVAKADKLIKSNDTSLGKVKKQAKELGVKTTDIKEVVNIERALDSFKKLRNELKDFKV
tara:strand:- start:43 stop:417 length:375 start_codon:yes stop_codon:yes gene_type:complete